MVLVESPPGRGGRWSRALCALLGLECLPQGPFPWAEVVNSWDELAGLLSLPVRLDSARCSCLRSWYFCTA